MSRSPCRRLPPPLSICKSVNIRYFLCSERWECRTLYKRENPSVSQTIDRCTMGLQGKETFGKFYKVKTDFFFDWQKNKFLFVSMMQYCPSFRVNIWFQYIVKYLSSLLQKKNRKGGDWQLWKLVRRAVMSCWEITFKIAFLSEEPLMEQISSKNSFPTLSSKRYLAILLATSFNFKKWKCISSIFSEAIELPD